MKECLLLYIVLLSFVSGCTSGNEHIGIDDKKALTTRPLEKDREQTTKVHGIICDTFQDVLSLVYARREGLLAFNKRFRILQKLRDDGTSACEFGIFIVEQPVLGGIIRFNDGRENLVANILAMEHRTVGGGGEVIIVRQYIVAFERDTRGVYLNGTYHMSRCIFAVSS